MSIDAWDEVGTQLEQWFLEDGLEAIADLVDGVEATRNFVERMKGLTSSEDNDKNQRNAGRALGGIFALSQLRSWKYEE